MKIMPFTSIAALLLVTVAGCTSVNSSRNDEAKVVARILARTASAPLVFKDQPAAMQILLSLDTSEHFTSGAILDAHKKVFASYSRPDQLAAEQNFLAKVTQSAPIDQSETLVADNGGAIAIVRIGSKEQTFGYVAVATKRH